MLPVNSVGMTDNCKFHLQVLKKNSPLFIFFLSLDHICEFVKWESLASDSLPQSGSTRVYGGCYECGSFWWLREFPFQFGAASDTEPDVSEWL